MSQCGRVSDVTIKHGHDTDKTTERGNDALLVYTLSCFAISVVISLGYLIMKTSLGM